MFPAVTPCWEESTDPGGSMAEPQTGTGGFPSYWDLGLPRSNLADGEQFCQALWHCVAKVR